MYRIDLDSEKELEDFVFNNITYYFDEDCLFLLEKRKIRTTLSKETIPDGFILDISRKKLVILEIETKKHDVFDHIARQLIKIIVAFENMESKRNIRDLLIEKITGESNTAKLESVMRAFNIASPLSIHSAIEGILNNQPELFIFIDEINTDLKELCTILRKSIPVRIIEVFKCTDGESSNFVFNDNTLSFSEGSSTPIEESSIYTIEDHLIGKPEAIVTLTNRFRDAFKSIDRNIIFEYPKQQYIGYTTREYQNARQKPTFALIIVHREYIRILFKLPPDSLIDADAELLLTAVPRTWQSGSKSYVDISDDRRFDYIVGIANMCYGMTFRSEENEE